MAGADEAGLKSRDLCQSDSKSMKSATKRQHLESDGQAVPVPVSLVSVLHHERTENAKPVRPAVYPGIVPSLIGHCRDKRRRGSGSLSAFLPTVAAST